MKKIYIIVILIFAVLYFCFRNKSKKENFTSSKMTYPEFKCVKPMIKKIEKEKDLTRASTNTRLLFGRPNKCFSCEREVLRKAGPKYINYAFPSKCFSCEKQSKNPYMEGPTKCFSCD